MGFLKSVIAESRSTVSEPVTSSPLVPAVTADNNIQSSSFKDDALTSDTGHRENAYSQGEVDSWAGGESPPSRQTKSSVITPSVNESDHFPRSAEGGNDIDHSSMPMGSESPVNRINTDTTHIETVVETVSQENGLQSLRTMDIDQVDSDEQFATEMVPTGIQPPVANVEPLSPFTVEKTTSIEQGNESEVADYLPSADSKKETDQSSHRLDEVAFAADSSSNISTLMTKQNNPQVSGVLNDRPSTTKLVSADPDDDSFSRELSEPVAKLPKVENQENYELEDLRDFAGPSADTPLSITEKKILSFAGALAENPTPKQLSGHDDNQASGASDKPEPENTGDLKKQFPANLTQRDSGNQEPITGEKLGPTPMAKQERRIVTEDRLVKEPAKPKHHKVFDSVTREKNVLMQTDAVASPSVPQVSERIYPPSMTTPQQVRKGPEVKIGQVDVFIEGQQRSSGQAKSPDLPTLGLASRYYLRRI